MHDDPADDPAAADAPTSAMPPHLTIRAFGAFEARLDGVAIALPTGLTRAIVARLAVAGGATVTAERLIIDLWDEPPSSAAGSLRVYLSRLRGGPLGDAIEGGRGGYALRVDADDVDLVRFTRLVEASTDPTDTDPTAVAADADKAYASLTAALALWRDDQALAEFAEFPFARAQCARLHELRRVAAQRLADLRLARGEADEAVLELAPLVRAAPTHEGLALALATAFAVAGRATEALATLDTHRRALADDGLDESAAVDRLRQRVLRRDGSLSTDAAATAERTVERHGIPVPLTSLVGRSDELARLAEARAGHRLVTLVGPGGAGKTRLAIETARGDALIDAEQWLVDLTGIADDGDVLRAVVETVGVPAPTLDAVAARVGSRVGLVILDNAEHVLAGVRDVVAGLLERSAGLGVLVTSREPLGLPGEFVVRVGGLAGGVDGDAETLFIRRATEARGGEAPRPAEHTAIARVCRLLDGLPLALELAAAHADVLDIGELADSLTRGDPMPGTTSVATRHGTRPSSRQSSRHASLEQTLRWSTDLLPPAELAALVSLSGFAGPFTLDAVDEIVRVEGVARPRDLVLALARKSLVAVEETGRGHRHYRLLESTKAFVRPLRDPATVPEWCARYRAYFADLVDQLAPGVRSHDADAVQDRLDAVAADLQVALDGAIAAGERDTALRIAGGQAWHWFKRGSITDGRRAIERARAVDGTSDPGIEAVAIVGLINLTYQSGDAETAMALTGEGAALAQAAGDPQSLALFLGFAGYGHSLFGDPAEAERLTTTATELSADAPDWLRADVLMTRGQALRALGRPSAALDSLAEAHRFAERSGHSWARTSSEYVTGKILIEVNRGREALPFALRAAKAAVQGDPTSGLALLHLVGGASAFVERHADGAAMFGAIDALGRRYGYHPVAVEGADAQGLRDRVAAGLGPGQYDAAYERGAELSFAGLLALAESVARPGRAA
jgi:predicted ATPase/DNA-binding SARP family transcriptional activator